MSLEAKKSMIEKERYWKGTWGGATLCGGCGGFGSELLTANFIKEFHKELGNRDDYKLVYQGRKYLSEDTNEITDAGHVCFYDKGELYEYQVEKCHQHSKDKDLIAHYIDTESNVQVARNSVVDFFILVKPKQHRTSVTYKRVAKSWAVNSYAYDSIEYMAKAIYGLTSKELEFIRKRDNNEIS